MADRHFQISTKTELLLAGPGIPAHLEYDSGNPDHAAIDESNPFFSALPAGQQLTFDGGGLPDGLEAIPAPVFTVDEQAAIDLQAADVTISTIAQARYLDTRGDGTLLATIDAAVDVIVISSGLTLAQVSALI